MTLDQEDMASIRTIVEDTIRRMMGVNAAPVSEPSQRMGSIAQCIPPGLCGKELHAFLRARKAEQKAAKNAAKKEVAAC